VSHQDSKQLSVPTPGAEATPFAGLSPEDLAGKRGSRAGKTSTQIVILMLVVAVSAIALWWMRKEGTRVGVTFAELKVDYSEPDAEKARTYARIMADLSRIQSPLDVALGEFGSSPFMLDTGKPVISPTGQVTMPTGPTPEEAAARLAAEKAEARRLELESSLASIRLQSVMDGRVPLARVDDTTVRVGDTVGTFFLVTKIEGRGLTVTADGQEFTLTINERSTDAPKKSPVKIGTPPKKGK